MLGRPAQEQVQKVAFLVQGSKLQKASVAL